MLNPNEPLPLNPVSDEWQQAWDELMQSDEWLRKKLDRRRRWREHVLYLNNYCPEFWDMDGGTVIDLGPGAGELLEMARHHGHGHIGIDDAEGKGMGKPYLEACRLMWQRQRLQGQEIINGAIAFFEEPDIDKESCCFVNSRGSLEQMFSHCMEGPPHEEHHDCMRLAWNETAGTRREIARMMLCVYDLLRPGGVFLIHANGAQNTNWTDIELESFARDFGFETKLNEPRLHKWAKPDDDK